MTYTLTIENPDREAEVLAAIMAMPEVRISPRPSYEGLHILPHEQITQQEFQDAIDASIKEMEQGAKGYTAQEILEELGIEK